MFESKKFENQHMSAEWLLDTCHKARWFAFGVDEIKDGFMSSGGKDNTHSPGVSMEIC